MATKKKEKIPDCKTREREGERRRDEEMEGSKQPEEASTSNPIKSNALFKILFPHKIADTSEHRIQGKKSGEMK